MIDERILYFMFIFQIKIREVSLDKTAHVKFSSNNKAKLVHTFKGVPRGAKYEISITTAAKGSIPANITASAHPLPAPKLMSVYPEKNGSYVVMWKEIREDIHET